MALCRRAEKSKQLLLVGGTHEQRHFYANKSKETDMPLLSETPQKLDTRLQNGQHIHKFLS